METQNVKAIKFLGHKVELGTNIKGKPTATFYRFLQSGKNKDTWKRMEGFYFASDERRKQWIEEKYNSVKKIENRKREKINKIAEARNDFKNPFKAGDIYYDSWGYEQTNIDFYLVTEVKNKSVMLQEIGCTFCEGGKGSGMSSNVKPDITQKIGDPFIKPIQIKVWNGAVHYMLASKHGSISKYDAGDHGVYCSWYH